MWVKMYVVFSKKLKKRLILLIITIIIDSCESFDSAMNSDFEAQQWWFIVNHMLLSAEKNQIY